MSFRGFSRLVPKQRPLIDYLQYPTYRHTGFIPFENQYSIWFKNSHALIEAVFYIILPFKPTEGSIFLSHICILICIIQMRWVEYYKFKRIVCVWHCCKVCHDIRVNFQLTAVTQCIFSIPNILEENIWILFVKPKHSAAATGI